MPPAARPAKLAVFLATCSDNRETLLTCDNCRAYDVTDVAPHIQRRAPHQPRTRNPERPIRPGQPRLCRRDSRRPRQSPGRFGRARYARPARKKGCSQAPERRPALHLLRHHFSRRRKTHRASKVCTHFFRRLCPPDDDGPGRGSLLDRRGTGRAAKRNRPCPQGKETRIMIPLPASIAAKVTVTLALGLLAARLARGRRAAVRHALLATSLAMLLAIPIVATFAPRLPIALTAAPPTAAPLAAVFIAPASLPAPAAPQPGTAPETVEI